MRKHKRAVVLMFALLVVAVVTAMTALHGQDRNDSSHNKQQKIDKKEFESQFPIVDYAASDLADPAKSAKRQAKAKKLFKPNLTIHENAGVTAGTASQTALIGSLAAAVAKSDAVIIGQVTNAQAYLNNDKNNVYSEFTVRVDEVLKDDSYAHLIIGNSVVATRNGGRVRYPSGRVTLYFITGEGMPRVEQRYMLFLSREEHEQDYDIVTGYELRLGRVELLDNLGDSHPLTVYKGMDGMAFLSNTRTAISGSSQATPEERR